MAQFGELLRSTIYAHPSSKVHFNEFVFEFCRWNETTIIIALLSVEFSGSILGTALVSAKYICRRVDIMEEVKLLDRYSQL